MQTHNVFLLLLAAFAVTVAGVSFFEPIYFMGLQKQLENVGTSTRAKFSAFQNSMDHRKRSLQKQLNFDIQGEEQDYKKKDKEILDKAKKQGKITDQLQTDICVNYGQAKHGVDLRVTHNQYMTCIDNATEVAKKVLDDARKKFSESFDSSANAKNNEKNWRKCLKPPDDKCVKEEKDKYSKKIESAKKVSEEKIAAVFAANKTLYTVTNDCVGDLQKEILDLQKAHYEITSKCITAPEDTKKKIMECMSALQKI